MLRYVVLLMIVIPALEIWGFLKVGQWIGAWQTIALIILTGIVGAYLVKLEARKVMAFARDQMAVGQLPGRPMLDGICLLVGGLLLITPGFLTDLVGFLLVLPFSRVMFRDWILRIIRRKIEDGSFHMSMRRW